MLRQDAPTSTTASRSSAPPTSTRRSLFLNYEVVLALYQDLTRRLRASQARLLRQAETLDPDAWERRPERQRYLQHTAKLLSPVL